LSETEKIAATAKVWGFLKYYHPAVADGKYNWDEQLFDILPKVENSTGRAELSQIYLAWINDLGEVKKCKKCEIEQGHEFFNKNFDLSWIENERFVTPELSEKLKYIERNRHQGKKYYVSTLKATGNIKVTNEKDYEGFDWQDKRLRLLSLFRYWNIVEYFFPYKYQTDTDWDEVLSNMIPKFLHPKSEKDFHLAMLELIVSIDDSHAGFSSDITRAYFGNYWIPAGFRLIDEKAVITYFYDDSLASIDDLRIGDAITKIDDKDVIAIFKENEKYISGSNQSRKKRYTYNTIVNGSTESVNIEYERGGKSYSKSIKRYLYGDFNFNRQKQEPYKILDGNIGYVNIGAIRAKDIAEVMTSIKDTRAIIFDIRTYPREFLLSITNYISSTTQNFWKKTCPDLDYPGKFIWENGNRGYNEDGDLEYKEKVVVLVNERTQSMAEFTAMCLQTGDNVTTIGSQTSGADGNISEIPLVGGFKTNISGFGVFYPNGTETQRTGVKIDIHVEPTIQGIIEGRDEVLERAIEFVNE
jgi:C-terminal processing protease CtpA/Prc